MSAPRPYETDPFHPPSSAGSLEDSFAWNEHSTLRHLESGFRITVESNHEIALALVLLGFLIGSKRNGE